MTAPSGIDYVIRRSFYPPFNGERVKTASVATALAATDQLTIVDMGRDAYPGNRFANGETFPLPYGGHARFFSAVRVYHPWLAGWMRLSGRAVNPPWLWRTTAARWRACLRLLADLSLRVLAVDHPLLASASSVPVLAYAKPLVTTPVGAEGLELVDGEHALIRELGPAFDEAVAAVALGPARFQAMAGRGRELAWRRFSQGALTRIIRDALRLP